MTNHGYGFICLYNDILVKKNTGKTLLKTKNSSAIKPLELDLDLDDYYLLITSCDYLLIGNLQKIPILPRGRGIKLINLPKKSAETIVFSGI